MSDILHFEIPKGNTFVVKKTQTLVYIPNFIVEVVTKRKSLKKKHKTPLRVNVLLIFKYYKKRKQDSLRNHTKGNTPSVRTKNNQSKHMEIDEVKYEIIVFEKEIGDL